MKFGDCRCSLTTDMQNIARITVCDTNRHCNACYELHICLRGSCVMGIDEKSYFLSERDAVLIAPGRYHCQKEEGENHEHFVIPFDIKGGSTAGEIAVYGKEIRILQLTEFEASLCQGLLEEYRNKEIFWRKNVYSICFLLLSGLFRRISDYISHREQEEQSFEKPRFGIIDNFFEENLTEDCTEENLAGKLNLSRRQLQRVLMKHYGMGFREKRRLARLDHAGWLLRTSDMPIWKICEVVGYQSEPSFFKAFKDHYGVSPAIYRQENEQQ